MGSHAPECFELSETGQRMEDSRSRSAWRMPEQDDGGPKEGLECWGSKNVRGSTSTRCWNVEGCRRSSARERGRCSNRWVEVSKGMTSDDGFKRWTAISSVQARRLLARLAMFPGRRAKKEGLEVRRLTTTREMIRDVPNSARNRKGASRDGSCGVLGNSDTTTATNTIAAAAKDDAAVVLARAAASAYATHQRTAAPARAALASALAFVALNLQLGRRGLQPTIIRAPPGDPTSN